jgi:N-glycosylase/DNA lyase
MLMKKALLTFLAVKMPAAMSFAQGTAATDKELIAKSENEPEPPVDSDEEFEIPELKVEKLDVEEIETGKLEISGGKTNRQAEEKILRDVRHILRLDEDLRDFYKYTKAKKELAWIGKRNAGRLLRSPTVFEDLVKTICTTNCSWALTKKMTANLVEKLGEKTADGKSAFPTAARMAGVSAEFYRDEIRAGYRSAYFAELAEKVASGKINPESWLASNLPTKELKKEMKQIKGVGDYAAENLLKLVGRYDGLALDSWLRAQFYKKHNAELVCNDEKIEKHYEQFGDWRGLAIWCDMTERWFK